jgi:hypothetical protein
LLGIALLLSSLVALGFVQLMTKALGVPSMPPRLLYAIVVGDCAAIVVCVWLLVRGKTPSGPSRVANPRTSVSLSVFAKTLGVYAIIEAVVFGLVYLTFGISLKKVWFSYLLFLTPMLLGLPLMLHARRFRDQPKSFAFWLALGSTVVVALEVTASYYSGVWNWLNAR